MPQYIKNDLHIELAKNFLDDIQYQRTNYYYYLGKCSEYTGTISGDPDLNTSAQPQTDTNKDNTRLRSDMIYIKRIDATDSSLVIPRYNWDELGNTVWDFYDDDVDLSDKKYYCCVDNGLGIYNVYKCLDSGYDYVNNKPGAIATVKPTTTPTSPIVSSDGYVWKYMYTIPPFKQLKFMNQNYIPVQTALSDSFYNRGSASEVIVLSGGSGYNSSTPTTLIVAPPSSGTTAVLLASIATETREAIISPEGYILQPKVLAGSITDVTIINKGSGYLTAPSITVNGTGTGLFSPNSSAILQTVIVDGKVERVNILDPGKDYTPNTTDAIISVSGNGVGAKFTPVVYNGSIVDVIIDNIGEGYSYMNLNVKTTGLGTGAVLSVVIQKNDYKSAQAQVEQSTVEGQIFYINVESGGSGYVEPYVVIDGDYLKTASAEYPAVATAISVAGIIKYIKIEDPGQGYTYATAKVYDRTKSIENPAVLRVILSPRGGHGKDAIKEFSAKTVAINSYLNQDSILNKLNQDYRQYGILKNPTLAGTYKIFRDTSALLAHEVQFSNLVEWSTENDNGIKTELFSEGDEDILIYRDSNQFTYEFRVIAIDGLNATLQQIGTRTISPIGDLELKRKPGVFYRAVKAITIPSVDKYSGSLIYSSDENPFSFTEGQGLAIKTFIKF